MKCYNKSILLIACMLIFLLIGAVSANKNNTISNVSIGDNVLEIGSVNQTNGLVSSQNGVVDQFNNLTGLNSSLEVNTPSKSFDDLQNVIDNSSDNSVLDLDCNYTYGGNGDFSGITINKNNFTIDGHGHTIDAKSATNSHVRIFNVTGTNILLKNLHLINADVTGHGGAIQNTGTNVTINNSVFINNKASSVGGAINNNGVGFTVSNSTFTNNKASYGGAIGNDGDNFAVCNSIFNGNTASMKGGAINTNHAINVSIKNSSFINNTANSFGGAIHNDDH